VDSPPTSGANLLVQPSPSRAKPVLELKKTSLEQSRLCFSAAC
jgi:hypothetical protein